MDITKIEREMLERICRATDTTGALLALTITAEGGRERSRLRRLLALNLAETCNHPTIKRGDAPAMALRITTSGRAVLACPPPASDATP